MQLIDLVSHHQRLVSNNTSLAKDRKDFLDGSQSISRDEQGKSVSSSSTHVWTSTDQNGIYSASNNLGWSCENWMSKNAHYGLSTGSAPTFGGE